MRRQLLHQTRSKRCVLPSRCRLRSLSVASRGEALIATSATAAPVWARPLQSLRCRSLILFEFPAAYLSVPVSIPWGRRVEWIALIGAAVSHRLLRWSSRWRRKGNLRPDGVDDGSQGAGERDANYKMPHPGAPSTRSAPPLNAQSASSCKLRLIFPTAMQPDLSPEDCAAIAALLREVIAADRFPISPRIKRMRVILNKLDPPVQKPAAFPPLKPPGAPSRARH